MEFNWKNSADSAKSRSNIYGLLAAAFREEPSKAFIKELRSSRLSGIFSDLGVELGEAFVSGSDSELMEVLKLEFTRLFIGPDHHISAHESVFVESDAGGGGLWGAKTVEVKKFIETTGLDYESEYTGMPDHISVELEFMQNLTEFEAIQWVEKNREDAEKSQKIQRMFLEQHLLCWSSQFCDTVIAEAKNPFYRAMAELTRNYMEFERSNIASDEAA